MENVVIQNITYAVPTFHTVDFHRMEKWAKAAGLDKGYNENFHITGNK